MRQLNEAEGSENGVEGKTARISQPAENGLESRGKPKRVHVIINPAAGQGQPILKELNTAFQNAEIDWGVSITKHTGDGRRLAQEALQAGVDVVAVHGGDGTVMEVASGMIGSEVPLAILPGGTANVMSVELGIPVDLPAACALALNPDAGVKKVDMGQVSSQDGEHYFILRASLGIEAHMVEGADRQLKDRLGVLAYGLSALQSLVNPPVAHYHLLMDGKSLDADGVACIIANSGTLGRYGFQLAPDISVSDGLLDVVVIARSDLPGLVALAASVVGGSENRPSLQHWQVREVTVEADPRQHLQLDGEILEVDTVKTRVIPQAIKVILPPPT